MGFEPMTARTTTVSSTTELMPPCKPGAPFLSEAGTVGVEPTTFRLTAGRSAIELRTNRTNHYTMIVKEIPNLRILFVLFFEHYFHNTAVSNSTSAIVAREESAI